MDLIIGKGKFLFLFVNLNGGVLFFVCFFEEIVGNIVCVIF